MSLVTPTNIPNTLPGSSLFFLFFLGLHETPHSARTAFHENTVGRSRWLRIGSLLLNNK